MNDTEQLSPKVTFFSNFINQDKISALSTSNEVDSLFYNGLVQFQINDKEGFIQNYANFTQRKPSKRLSYIHDNYLLFSLIICVKKFQCNSDWLKKVLELRKCTSEPAIAITETFKNILRDNFHDKDNNFSIILVYEELLNKTLLNQEEIVEEFLKIRKKHYEELLSKNDFLRIIVDQAFNITIKRADITQTEHVTFLRKFEKKFLKRVGIFSNVYYHMFCLSMITLGFYLFIAQKEIWGKIFETIDVGGAVCTFLGFGTYLANMLSEKRITKFITSIFYWLFGYKK